MSARWSLIWLQWLQWGLLVMGIALLGWCGYDIGRARWFQARQHAALARISPLARHADTPGTSTHSSTFGPNVIGVLDIPRLKVSAVVAEGDDEDTLKVAVGHLPDTPFPWQAGNSVLAGHRDTFFRALKGVRPGDEIRLATSRGELRYRVERTLVVEPDDVSVVEPSPERRLTLITCFPFSYIGHAPQRFIVQAQHDATAPS